MLAKARAPAKQTATERKDGESRDKSRETLRRMPRDLRRIARTTNRRLTESKRRTAQEKEGGKEMSYQRTDGTDCERPLLGVVAAAVV